METRSSEVVKHRLSSAPCPHPTPSLRSPQGRDPGPQLPRGPSFLLPLPLSFLASAQRRPTPRKPHGPLTLKGLLRSGSAKGLLSKSDMAGAGGRCGPRPAALPLRRRPDSARLRCPRRGCHSPCHSTCYSTCHSPAARAEPSPPRRTDLPRTAQNGSPGSEVTGGMALGWRQGWRRSGGCRSGGEPSSCRSRTGRGGGEAECEKGRSQDWLRAGPKLLVGGPEVTGQPRVRGCSSGATGLCPAFGS